MVTEFTRRTALSSLGLGLAATAFFPGQLWALTQQSATTLVNSLVNDINKVINSGKSERSMYKDFERIFSKYADVTFVALASLGVDARRATDSQKRAYVKAYQGYISRKYGKRFREFIGGRLELQGTKSVKNYIEVKTMAHLRGEAPFDVTFLVSDRSGKPKFFNMYIEGVNMVLTEKAEIGAMLDRRGGNIDQLIADLQKAS
jgi:phospholipid transport system substrate-binding protein